MNPLEDPRDDESLASLLAAANKDMAPTDREFLDRLREQSTELFRESVSQQTAGQARRRHVITWAVRGLAASLAAAMLLGVVLFYGLAPKRSDLAFGNILKQVGDAQTLHLSLTHLGHSGEVWARQPHQLRWNDAEGTYKIADGAKLWRVNECENRASLEPSRYYREGNRLGLDVADLLRISDSDAWWHEFLERGPLEQIERDGVRFHVYRMEIPAGEGRYQTEALVDAATRRLHSIAIKVDRNGKVEPITELTVLAYDEPVADERFVVSDTLTEDGRIGKVTDAQGIVTIKPVMHERWTPVRSNLLLKPGDWLRTDVRGANAAGLRLVKQTGVILGPGTLVELIKPAQIRLHEGELEITVPDKAALELLGPGQQSIAVKGTQRYRVAKEKLVSVAAEPSWLKGFKGATANESIGSLIAKVDGRNVPLTVGYHKVSVDIRDQIARTVIEESFVNHTNAQLEGVFHFPLPQDASISGFGMWIGDQLIEADVVEKQRAREIYETILRERRDPGLLEWSGGNIFKARVFPIFAHSEKRIKITYTQVLPLMGSHYRYSYGLQSELLKQHPLKELAIDVKVNSAVPLRSVTSPTHSTRSDHTAHSGHVEFTAQEYTPTRDFEVVIEVDRGQSDVVVIPHRRGDDGYFMLQLTPPSTGKPAQESRDLLPDSEPLALLILADTSASMDAAQRSVQAGFVAALLASLTPKDTINLAACDVDCDWAFEKAAPADMKNVTAARLFLANRTSLGWTDLDKAFASALQQSGPKTHVIYVGDAIVTTGDADPVAFGQRLRRLYQGKAGIFHAVTTGNSFEPAAVKAIASLGGGSLRRITGEQGPQAVALELLNEIAQPTLRDLNVEFNGLRVARVYPEQLSNIPAGSQQILLGRYQPEGRDQTREVIVTGMQGNKPVRLSTPITLKDAEKGNSFIPRLWARMHLDSLLEQGTSESIKDEIIALSEEYNIITPYTSFLVLETDADRERFKVKRRFQMRDGEKFFAEGRDNANYELVQKQMKKAGNWRLGLRRTVLQQLATLGRDLRLIQPQTYAERLGRWGGPVFLGDNSRSAGSAGPEWFLIGNIESRINGLVRSIDFDLGEVAGDFKNLGDGERDELAALDYRMGETDKAEQAAEETPALTPAPASGLEPDSPEGRPVSLEESQLIDLGELAKVPATLSALEAASARRPSTRGEFGYFLRKSRIDRDWDRQPSQWLDTLFPHLPGSPGVATEPVSTWPDQAQALVRSLLRTDKLVKLTGGIEIERKTEHFDVRWKLLSSRSQALELYSRTAWLTWRYADGQPMLINWCDGIERGVFSTAFQLGRLRASTAQDLSTPPLELSDYSLTSLERSYPGYTATLQPQGMERTLLVLRHPSNPLYEMRVLIDTARHVILQIEQLNSGKVTSTIKFDDFLEVAGCWWARRIETTDDKGRLTSRASQTVKAMPADPFTKLVKKGLTGKEQVLFIHEPLPSVVDAKRALTQLGRLTFDVELVLVLHFSRSQRWARVMEHMEQAERLAAGKPGIRWVRYAVLNASRQHEALSKRLLAEADEIGKRHACAGGDHADQLALADYLIGQGAQFLQANEMLALLKNLQPVYARQARYTHSMKRWQQMQASYLRQAGQPEEALRVEKQLATDYPHDLEVQRQYAQALVNVGDFDAAYALLTRALGKSSRWSPEEETSLRDQYAQFLYQQGRYADLVSYLADWIKLNPEAMAVYQQYLSALIRANQVDKANTLIAQWLKEGQASGELPPATVARLAAAINLALGQGHNLQSNRLEERWLAPLAEVALFLARHETQSSLADHIMANSRFQQTDACRKVRKTAGEILIAEISKLRFDQIQRFVHWISPDDPALEPAAWKHIADGLRQRWSAEINAEIKNQLGQPLVQILTSRFAAAEVLAFLRIQVEQGPNHYRPAHANQLFDKLLTQPWSAGCEDEAFALLGKLSDADAPGDRLPTQVMALYRLTSAMVDARFTARMKAVEHQEKLTRIELQKKKDENLRLARAGFSERLQKEIKASGGRKPPENPWVHWLTIERLYLETLLERDLKELIAACWEFLGAQPPKNLDWWCAEQRLDAVLRDRFLLTLIKLAIRKDAEPALIDRLLKYLDAGIAGDGESDHSKLLKFQLLIALDRPKDLEQVLQQWIRSDDPVSRWRISLGNLLAEQGRISEAIKIFEAVEASDELGPAAYRTLADWYMVVNRRAEHERAQGAVYKAMDEYAMSRWLRAKLYPWQRADRNLPTELDNEVLLVFKALFEKSSRPADYLGYLQQFYQACRDFRLLSGMADAVIGHSAGQVYLFLQGMSGILGEVRNEATVDDIVEHLKKVRLRAKTLVDQRALDLLEVLVERRAAELKNQPGPHVEVALAALQRAFKREWSNGEQRLMADLLASLGAISQPALAKEQLHQLEVLHRDRARGSYDRLHIADRFANALSWYSRTAEAVDLLEAALKEYQDANGGDLPQSAYGFVSTMTQYLQVLRHYERGEKILFAYLQHPLHQQNKLWLTEHLYQLYHHALQYGGTVSLGTGQALYQAVERKVRGDLGTVDHEHRSSLVNLLCGIYRTAHEKKLAGVVEDLKAFAANELAEILKRQTSNYTSIVSTVAQTLHDLAGVGEGLAFLIARIEQEPYWFRFNNQDGWNNHAWTIGEWRSKLKDLGDLEERLLKIVTAELRRDLETRQQRNRAIYHQHNGHYWAEKADPFAQVAEDVLAKQKQSGAAAKYIAEYFYWGLGRNGRAIEVLFAADRAKILDEGGQSQLVNYLHMQNRYAESIPLLQPLVKTRPENMSYRVQLMHAYFRTGQPGELRAQLKETDAFFHQKDRWIENALAALGHSCLQNELYSESVAYYNELIPLHQRTQPRQGIGNGTLSDYYTNQARAYAGLKKTAEAVDAASGAIISWGLRHAQRDQAVGVLREVLHNSPDLDAYVVQLDKTVAENGQDRPIVRKAIGQAYLERAKYAQAIAQLQAAAELQPNDAETHQALIACYDKQGDKEGAIRQLLQSLQLSRRDIKLYEELGRRLEELKQPKEVERAYTSIVEVLPAESESHALLAEIRQKQNRWGETIPQWEQVARIRALEPTGLVNLAEAQVHEKQWNQAAETLRKLTARSWPARFDQLPNQIRKLQHQIEQK